MADNCCRDKYKCSDCGCEIVYSNGHCDKCSELKRVRAAAIVLDYQDEEIYLEGMVGSLGDGYFANICELTIQCEDEEIELPSYVYACKPAPFKFDIFRQIESYIEDNSIPDYDYEPVGYDQMVDFMKDWIARQPDFGIEQDLKRIIVLDDEQFKDYLAGDRKIDLGDKSEIH